jgi:hypothetical protein
MKKLVNGTLLNMTDAELTNLSSSVLDPDAEMLTRSKRNRLLSDTDWMALSDNTMTPEWASYRQALRDITEQEGFPYSVTWPTKQE